jgi:hypothetical protein
VYLITYNGLFTGVHFKYAVNVCPTFSKKNENLGKWEAHLAKWNGRMAKPRLKHNFNYRSADPNFIM